MSPSRLFRDRRVAGEKLAARLRSYQRLSPVVLGLPRGGVPVAYEVALELDAPLDVCVVRKIGAPFQPELGIGAISEGGVSYVDREAMSLVGMTDAELDRIIESERATIEQRVRLFRAGAELIDVEDRAVIVVDDGVATGGTARAAIQTLTVRRAGRIIFAAPVGAAETLDELAAIADDLVCLHPEEEFFAVGQWYEDFRATTDDEVVDLLARAKARERLPAPEERMRSERVRVPMTRSVQISTGERSLYGRLTLVPDAYGLVIFAHGKGSGRHSPRNQYVASELQAAGMATLLVDLISPEEDMVGAFTSHSRGDVGLLASRLVAAIDWTKTHPETQRLKIGLFGGGEGAAAALLAAAERPDVRAVVSRAGMPDMAGAALERVAAATLLLVGGANQETLERNRLAFDRLHGDRRLEVIPNTSQPFEEEPALEIVARSAVAWFRSSFDPHGEMHKVTA